MCSVSLFVSWHISSIEYFSPFDPLSILLVIYASSPSDILINPCLAVLIPTASLWRRTRSWQKRLYPSC